MGAIESKTRINGLDVDLSVVEQPDGSLKISAACSGEIHEHVVTIGGADQPLPDEYDEVWAQIDLDDAREFAARMAASKVRRKAVIAGLK